MKYTTILSMLLVLFLAACTNNNQSSNYQGEFGKYAKQAFLEEQKYMSEREALSKEIHWYKEPQITSFSYEGDLSGKDIISLCNKIEAENESKTQDISDGIYWVAICYNVSDIKEYALDHADELIASRYHISGIFTTYSEEHHYSTESNNVIVVRGINKIIILSDSGNFVTFGVVDFKPKWYESFFFRVKSIFSYL